MKTAWIDLETTGLDPLKNGIIQIAGWIEVKGERTNEFNWLVKPFKGQIVSKKALEVNGKTIEEIRTYPEPFDIYKDLHKMLAAHINKYDRSDKFHFIGYNARFDMDFLRQFFKLNGEEFFGSYFHFPPIDVMAIAAHSLMADRHRMNNFKLTTVAQYLGIKFQESEAHDGLFDIQLTQKVLHELQKKTMARAEKNEQLTAWPE